MIVNIPLQIDDEMLNSVIAKDYERKIEKNLTDMLHAELKRQARGYYSPSASDGLLVLAERAVDAVIQENKEIVIERASVKLAERLAKTKAAKEVLK